MELAVLRIQRGDLDMMYERIPSGALDALRNDPTLQDQIVTATVDEVYYLTLSMKHHALKDLKVRQAIAMAVDKDRLSRVLKGLFPPAYGGLFSPLSPYYQDGLAYPFDPEKAKQLLAETGYSDGFEVTVWGQNVTPYSEMGQTVEQDLSRLGIKVDLRLMETDAFFAKSVESPPGILEFGWELPYPHGSYIMDGAFTRSALESGCCNYSAWVNPSFDKLAADAHRALDEREVVQLYKQMDRMVVREHAVWVPMIYGGRADLISKRVRGFETTKSPSADVKVFERYWLEEQ